MGGDFAVDIERRERAEICITRPRTRVLITHFACLLSYQNFPHFRVCPMSRSLNKALASSSSSSSSSSSASRPLTFASALDELANESASEGGEPAGKEATLEEALEKRQKVFDEKIFDIKEAQTAQEAVSKAFISSCSSKSVASNKLSRMKTHLVRRAEQLHEMGCDVMVLIATNSRVGSMEAFASPRMRRVTAEPAFSTLVRNVFPSSRHRGITFRHATGLNEPDDAQEVPEAEPTIAGELRKCEPEANRNMTRRPKAGKKRARE